MRLYENNKKRKFVMLRSLTLTAFAALLSSNVYATKNVPDYKEEVTPPIIDEFCPQDDKLTLFYQTINQNSPLSYANNHLCIMNMLSFSGRFSMDFRYYDRYGIPFNGNVWGVGLRPMFGDHASQFWGSLNEASLFVDARIN